MIDKTRHHRRLTLIIPILHYLPVFLLMMTQQKSLSFRMPPVEYCRRSFTEISRLTANYDNADVVAGVISRGSQKRPLVETASSSRLLIVTAIADDDDNDNFPSITSPLARSRRYDTIVTANNNSRTTPWSPVTLPPSVLGCLLLLGVFFISTPAEAAIPSSLWSLPNTSSSPPITTRNQLSQSYEFQLLPREPVLTPAMEQIRRLQDLQDERLEKCAEEQNEGGTVLFDQCFMFGDMKEESTSEKLKFGGVKKRGEGRMMPPTW